MKHLILFLILAAGLSAFGDSTWSVPGRASEIATGQNALSTTAEEVLAGNKARRSCVILNNDASISVYIGTATVSSSTGILLKAGAAITINTTGPIYAIAASGTPTVSFLAEND